MDKVTRITAGIFIIIFVIVAGTGLYNAYVNMQYRNSLASTYAYTLTISTSEKLSNVTFFIPVPVDPAGDSPFVRQWSSRAVPGVPAGWETVLLGSGKGTMLKIKTPVIGGSDGGSYSVRISSDERVDRLIDTKSPQENDILFRPVQNMAGADCAGFENQKAGATCYRYLSAIYADYDSSPNARVEIGSTIAGRNEWKIFKPESNEYSNSITALMLGDNHGWVVAKGEVQAGSGSYDAPKI